MSTPNRDSIAGLVKRILGRPYDKLQSSFTVPKCRPRTTRQWVFLVIQVVAILSMILGWYLDHSDQTKWVAGLFAPRYDAAIELCHQMGENIGMEVNSTDPGFTEISSILATRYESEMPNLSGSDFTHMKVVDRTALAINISTDSNPPGPRITLSVTLRDGQALPEVPVPVSWLESEIKDLFLEGPLFRLSELLQWLGVVVTFIILVVEKVCELV